jgi:hypothetical protein
MLFRHSLRNAGAILGEIAASSRAIIRADPACRDA